MFGKLSKKVENHSKLIKAVRSNDIMYVSQLISSNEADPTFSNNEAIMIAIKDDNIPMLDILLENHDVGTSVNWDYLVEEAQSSVTKKHISKKRSFFEQQIRH